MLGDHQGFTLIGELGSDARLTLSKASLPAMARLKAGKDVVSRRKAIAKALAQVADDDPYWIEAFASHLTADGEIQAADAEAISFTAAWSIIDREMSDQIRSVNTQGSDPFSGRVMNAMTSAAPEFGKRMMAGKIDSDEVMFRVALAHLFRRDPDSAFQMFVIDAVARQIPKAMKMSLGSVVQSAIQRFDDVSVPIDAWGYVVVLRDLTGKQGYFLGEPDDDKRAMVDGLISRMREVLPAASDDEVTQHLLAAACSGFLFQGAFAQFADTMSIVFERMNMRFGVVYASEKEDERGQGTVTQIFEIPAETVEEARRKGVTLPQVRMHDDFRQVSEYIHQMQDMDKQRDGSH